MNSKCQETKEKSLYGARAQERKKWELAELEKKEEEKYKDKNEGKIAEHKGQQTSLGKNTYRLDMESSEPTRAGEQEVKHQQK